MGRLKEKFHHENWPMPVFYAPLVMYYLYNSLKLRKLNYFTAVNPALETGGLCGFSKFESFKLLPEEVIPKTIILKNDIYSESQIDEMLKEKGLSFPLVIKPDQGERGFLVSKVNTLRELTETLGNKTLNFDFLIQEYVDGPLELGVFVMRKKGKWRVSSLTSKNFLSVRGDGQQSLSELISVDIRGNKFFTEGLQKIDLDRVPDKNEEVILEPIGNHSRGTEFIDECSKITEEMHSVFDKFLKDVEGVNYSRLDLRTPSWSEFLKSNFKVMEINGVSAEPAHIYDPNVSLAKAYKDLFSHWSEMAVIAKDQLSKGTKTENFSDTLSLVKTHMKRKRDFLKMKNSIVDVVGCKGLDFSLDPVDLLNKFSVEELLANHKCSKATEGYERTVLYKNNEYEVVFCHWRSGDKSVVHLHPGAHCWFRCLSGEMLELRAMGQKQTIVRAGDIAHIEDSMGAHQMLNMTGDCAFSVHLYKKIKDN